MALSDDQMKVAREFQPLLKALSEKANEFGNMLVLGFVYGTTGGEKDAPFLMRFGNVEDTGLAFVHTCYALGVMGATLQNTMQIVTDGSKRGSTSPASLADKLALTLMAVPVEMMPDEVTAALKQYMDSRTPSEK